MKTCVRCSVQFDEEAVLDVSPPSELADAFLKDMEIEDISDLCPRCIEEFGVMSLMLFGE